MDDDIATLTVLIPRSLYSSIEEEAKQKDTTVLGIVHVALRSYFGEDKRKYPRLFVDPVTKLMGGERSVESEGELVAYLLALGKIWYRPGVLDISVVREITKYSSPWGKLDIRFAEDLLRESGEIAEALGDDKVILKHLMMAYRHWFPMGPEKGL